MNSRQANLSRHLETECRCREYQTVRRKTMLLKVFWVLPSRLFFNYHLSLPQAKGCVLLQYYQLCCGNRQPYQLRHSSMLHTFNKTMSHFSNEQKYFRSKNCYGIYVTWAWIRRSILVNFIRWISGSHISCSGKDW